MTRDVEIAEAAFPEQYDYLLQFSSRPDIVVARLFSAEPEDLLEDAPLKPLVPLIVQCGWFAPCPRLPPEVPPNARGQGPRCGQREHPGRAIAQLGRTPFSIAKKPKPNDASEYDRPHPSRVLMGSSIHEKTAYRLYLFGRAP